MHPWNQGQEGDAPFNMAMMYYFRLNDLLAAKDRASLDGDMNAYYSCLEIIYNNIYFKIKDEKEELVEIEKLLAESLNVLTGSLPSDARLRARVQSINFWQARKRLMKLDKIMNVVMDKKKMIFPRVEISKGLKGLREQLGFVKEAKK